MRAFRIVNTIVFLQITKELALLILAASGVDRDASERSLMRDSGRAAEASGTRDTLIHLFVEKNGCLMSSQCGV